MRLNMNKIYLEKLEYFKILERLSTFCHTYLGKKEALELMPSNQKDYVQKILNETKEATSLLARNSTPPISEIDDITLYIKKLESSNVLSCKALLSIVNILEMANNLKNYFEDFIDNEDYSNINMYFTKLYTNNNIVQKIRSSILDENTIADNASPQLATIRRKEKNLELSIKNKLTSILHSSSYSKYIQENLVTVRNDRYVIPIKQEYRSFVKGFIHDMSSSGATVFIEPIAVFDLNNELNNLKVEENIEIEKILQKLSSLLFECTNELQKDAIYIGKIDFLFAKAKYSNLINGITPIINNEKFFNLKNARHPLIKAEKVVKNSIKLGKDFSCIIITGPNTGGKTVTLKTVGLLELMACSGLNIPASENSSIFVFDEIFADIGDDQSIADSLSTFSSHILNIASIINTATTNSLVLVDELGSGTDPLEGANLAISILEYFKENNILTLATTHYQELKKYAILTPNVQNASVEFDIENLKPTYRLLLGIPGKSNAFEISQKLGIPKEIISNAKSKLTKQDIDFETLLKKIYDDKSLIEKQKEEIEKNLNQIELLKKSLMRDNSSLKAKEKELIDNAKIKAREILENAKDEATSLIKEMKQIENTSGAISDLNTLRNKINLSIKQTSLNNSSSAFSENPISKEEIKPGLTVFASNLGQNATVLSRVNKNDEAQIQIGAIKTNINIKYLEKAKKETNALKTNSNPRVSKSKTVSSEINVIGLTVDEAIPLVDKFLDDCFLAKLETVRIVHGKGTGKLRQGIHSFLKKQKYVKSFRIGTYGEGEMGVTIVELKI